MLQFQKEYNIAHQSFEDFVLVIFVLVFSSVNQVILNL